METLFITGAGPNGITGRLIKEHFEGKYNLLTPNSKELDLTNDDDVKEYFKLHHIDYVIHCATFRPTSVSADHFVNEELESNLRMYFSLASQSAKYQKMIYFGSGAEFDKSKPVINVKEDDFGRNIPKNKYGLSKYIMNINTQKSDNIYNVRLFGTINKYEKFTKNVISNLCVKAVMGMPLKLRQDCRFSFVDTNDVIPVLEYALTNSLKHHSYNLSMSKSYLLSELAQMIINLSGTTEQLSFQKAGINFEYTASNKRLIDEFPITFTPMHEAIVRVYTHYNNIKDTLDISKIDSRWK